jgi:hypothetical protein
MVHGGAGKLYAPNECVEIAVITIVVQLGVLQKFAKHMQSASIDHAVANAYQSFFEFVSPCRTVMVRRDYTELYFFMLVRPLPAKKRSITIASYCGR